MLSLCTGDTPSDLVLRWASETFSHLLELFNSSAGDTAGAQLISGYHLWQVCNHVRYHSTRDSLCDRLTTLSTQC